jgi:hypothetical protein
MADRFPPAAQRSALLALVQALGCRDAALRRNDCGDWSIKGRFGCINAAPEGFQIYYRGADEFIERGSPHGWSWAKKLMSFARLTQDGDEEGILTLDRMPSPAEAEIIRDKLWLAKKREISDDELARLRRQGYRTGGEESARRRPF